MYNPPATGTGTHHLTTSTAVTLESHRGWMMEVEQLRVHLRSHDLHNVTQRWRTSCSEPVWLVSSSTSMESFMGFTFIPGSSCCSMPKIATAETPLELLPRVVGMRGVACLVSGVAMRVSSSSGVWDILLWCVRKTKNKCRSVLLSTQWSKGTFRTENTSDLTQVRICISNVWLSVLTSLTYVIV